jgi:hypothetical protein
MIDSGNPFGPGREITHTSTKELTHDKEAVTGYLIINAEILMKEKELPRTVQ